MAVELAVLGTLFVDCAFGVIVYFTNRKRVVNQFYLLFAACVALWQLSGWYILQATSTEEALIGIRLASVFAAIIPTACHLLRLSIKYANSSFFSILHKGVGFLILNAFTTAFCFIPFFLESATLPTEYNTLHGALVEPQYGNGLALYALYFLLSGIALIVSFQRDLRLLRGVQRSELAFVVLGATIAFSVGSALSLSIPLLIGTSRFVPFSNALSIITLVATIGYGIATRRILGIATILRRTVAYSILALYLLLAYLLVWHTANLILTSLGIESTFPSQIFATLVMALTMAPVHGKLQKVSDKLIASKNLNISGVIKEAGNIFQSVSTQKDLLSHFSRLLLNSLGAEHIFIFLPEKEGFQQHFPKLGKGNFNQISYDISMVDLIRENREPTCIDSLIRTRETTATKATIRELSKHNSNIAIGIFSKANLSGIVLLGARMNGQIYDKNEQDALQILCNQFAVALENARLYTEMQDSKIRNEIMLDQLVSGVIVANPDRKISLINTEAQRITGLTEEQAIDQDINLLPMPVSKALENTLTTASGLRNIHAVLFAQAEENMHVRMGSAYLLGHDDKPMGALLVFTDMTEIKSMEEQVRRSDQLSSVGTLAAGMAHEIKNPLVTIKTFTQLLPERYGDADFRKDFSSLVAHEVSRIDGIVNQLLSFSKPSQPHLVPMKLHETVAKTLQLIHEQLSQKNIELKEDFRATQDFISGDADLLTQTLVNLNLNAIDAIESDGVIKVSTANCTYRFANGDDPECASVRSCIRLQISDTGKGISKDQLHKIFDPFFTSKSEGTGMGLSVAHGIIQEHRGVIEVQSEQGKGTTFNIYIPLLKEAAAA